MINIVLINMVLQNVSKDDFKDLANLFAKDKDEFGIIHIPKQIGMYIAKK